MTENPIVEEDLLRVVQSNIAWKNFNEKIILISGGAGFLASYLTKSILLASSIYKLNAKVICLVRSNNGVDDRLSSFLSHENLTIIKHDISLPLPSSVPRADFVIHSASQASPKYYGTDPVGTLLANSVGTVNLLEYAKKSKSEKFLFFSTGEVYGIPINPNLAVKESDFGYIDPFNVRSCYAESKRVAETMCSAWAKQYGLGVSIVRPFHTYGPGMYLNDGRVFADFVSNVLTNKDIVLKSDGSAKRSFCYIADATIGFLTALLRGGHLEAYNIGNPEAEVSILELAKILSGLFPERKIGIRFEVIEQGDQYLKSPVDRCFPSIEKIKKIGWFPTTDIESGFKRTINSFLK